MPLPFIVCASCGAAMGPPFGLFAACIVQIHVSTVLKTPPLLHGTREVVTRGHLQLDKKLRFELTVEQQTPTPAHQSKEEVPAPLGKPASTGGSTDNNRPYHGEERNSRKLDDDRSRSRAQPK